MTLFWLHRPLYSADRGSRSAILKLQNKPKELEKYDVGGIGPIGGAKMKSNDSVVRWTMEEIEKVYNEKSEGWLSKAESRDAGFRRLKAEMQEISQDQQCIKEGHNIGIHMPRPSARRRWEFVRNSDNIPPAAKVVVRTRNRSNCFSMQ